jgi:hypothetical protein
MLHHAWPVDPVVLLHKILAIIKMHPTGIVGFCPSSWATENVLTLIAAKKARLRLPKRLSDALSLFSHLVGLQVNINNI